MKSIKGFGFLVIFVEYQIKNPKELPGTENCGNVSEIRTQNKMMIGPLTDKRIATR